jgi:hypothetical protein
LGKRGWWWRWCWWIEWCRSPNGGGGSTAMRLCRRSAHPGSGLLNTPAHTDIPHTRTHAHHRNTNAIAHIPPHSNATVSLLTRHLISLWLLCGELRTAVWRFFFLIFFDERLPVDGDAAAAVLGSDADCSNHQYTNTSPQRSISITSESLSAYGSSHLTL